MNTTATGLAATAGALHPTLKDPETGEPLINVEKVKDYVANLAREVVKENAERLGLMADECRASAKVLEQEMQAIGYALEKSKGDRKLIVDNLRSMRMTTTTEVAATLKPLADVRAFFLSDDHAKEIGRLREFVDLCERLERLKKDGFLDAVADTILKLS